MSTTWNTKYGPRRVRHDPPTLEEAIFAARGLTDDPEDQVAIAAGLMELPLDDVRAALRKSPPPRKPAATVAFTNRGGMHRSVVVERKAPRRPANRPLGGRTFAKGARDPRALYPARMDDLDRRMMQRCIALSVRSGEAGEYPYGVVVCRDGKWSPN